MKQGKQFLRVLAAAFFMAVVAYLGISIASVVTDPLTTTLAISYEASEYTTVQGVIVREEQRLYANMPIIQATLSDGEKAAAGETLAMGYHSSTEAQSQADQEQISRQLERLETVCAAEQTQSEILELETEIHQRIVALNYAVNQGELDTAAQEAWDLQTAVLSRNAGKLDQNALESRIQSLTSEKQALTQSSSGGTALKAECSGWYASGADGYESILTPEAILSSSPQELTRLLDRIVSDNGAYGRLIVSQTWYLAAVMDYETAKQAQTLHTVRVDFTGSTDLSVNMKVVQVGTPDDNENCVVVFSCDSYLSQVLDLREVEAELAFSTCSGLRVPKAAIRLLEVQPESEEASEEASEETAEAAQEQETASAQEGQPQYLTGVYVIEGGRAVFKKVEILMDTGSAYVVREDASSTDNLWAGDEVIVSARNLFDGKVVR